MSPLLRSFSHFYSRDRSSHPVIRSFVHFIHFQTNEQANEWTPSHCPFHLIRILNSPFYFEQRISTARRRRSEWILITTHVFACLSLLLLGFRIYILLGHRPISILFWARHCSTSDKRAGLFCDRRTDFRRQISQVLVTPQLRPVRLGKGVNFLQSISPACPSLDLWVDQPSGHSWLSDF